ncbi:MAG: type III pantothenate kinase [Alphaproteobacteria bacterium]
MLLAVNIGNTNTRFAVFDGLTLIRKGQVPTRETKRLPKEIGDASFDAVVLGSVVPAQTGKVKALLLKQFSQPVRIAGQDLPWGIEIRCDYPEKVGADRLLCAVAAFARTGEQTIVIDAGTAVTVDLISADGAFCGGAIAPGSGLMLNALHAHAAQLPEVAFAKPTSSIGSNTEAAIRAGVYWGIIGMTRELIDRIRGEATEACHILCTGADGEMLAREINAIEQWLPDLALEGLALLHSRL